MPKKEIEPKDLATAFDLPPEEAIKYLKKKGYVVTFTADELEAIVHHRVFTVAGVMQADILKDIDELLVAASEQGTTYELFAKGMEAQLGLKGWSGAREVVDPKSGAKKVVNLTDPHRMMTIFRTNIQASLNAGRYEQQKKVASSRPYVQLLVAIDPHTSDVCRPLAGKVFRQDDPELGRVYPPNHFQCRTLARTLSEKALERKGLEVSEVGAVEGWQPGKGFDALPDAEWKPDLSKYPKAVQKELRKDLAANGVKL